MKISTVAVIGAGTMGSGIAQKLATAGLSVVLVDTHQKAAEAGRQRIERVLVEGLEKELFTGDEVDRILDRIRPTTELAEVREAELVIEAIDEVLDAKRALFAELGELTTPETILATNTTSFLVGELASACRAPERVLGLHFFFHPVKNHLVEVVEHADTAEEVSAAAWQLMERIGNAPIAARDAPGFLVYRFWVPLTNEAVRIHEEGVNLATIEEVAKGTFGTKRGPFELMNLAGIPVALQAARSLQERLGELYAPPPALALQVHNGTPWELTGEIDFERASEIADRLCGMVFHVALQLVSDGVGSIDDVDVGARMGLHWPLGPFEMMNNFGLEQTRELCRRVEVRHDLEPPGRLTEQLGRAAPFELSRVSQRVTKDGIARLTLNRPDRLNVLGREMIRQLAVRFDEAVGDPSVRAIIIAGAGKTFSNGADLTSLANHVRSGEVQPILDCAAASREVFTRIASCDKPVLCLLDGVAKGPGAELALACHGIVATPRAALAFPDSQLGLLPAHGGTWRLARRVGKGVARYVLYSGISLSADQLVDTGLAWRIVRTEHGEEVESALREAVLEAPERAGAPVQVAASEMKDVGAFLAAVPVEGLVDGSLTLPGGVGSTQVAEAVRRKAPNVLTWIADLTELADRNDHTAALGAEKTALAEVLGHPNALEGLSALFEGRRPRFVR